MPSVCPLKRVFKMAVLKFRMHVTDQKAGSRTWKQPIPVMFPTALDRGALKRTGRNHKARPGGNQNPCQKRLFLGSTHRSAHVVRSAHHWRFRTGPDAIVVVSPSLLRVFVVETLSPPAGADGWFGEFTSIPWPKTDRFITSRISKPMKGRGSTEPFNRFTFRVW